ncbi:MAG: hypothetical protein HYV46_03285 [candidate division NC10 bacterium]|nr:hypothetical protein [candidate division NC10 bacterium]
MNTDSPLRRTAEVRTRPKLMTAGNGKFLPTEEWSFAVLRALAMLGGMVALFLVPLRPEHQPHLLPLAWAFVAYKVLLFLAIRAWPERLRLLLLGTVGLDLLFVSLFVWFSGGLESHFYLLFYLLVALAAVHFGPGMALGTAGGAGVLYGLASLVGTPAADWHHLSSRVATFFLLGGALGFISQRERVARAEAERLNEELQEHQSRLEKAYHELQATQERLVQSERLATIGQMSAKVDRRAEAAGLLAAIRTQVDVLSAVTEEYLRFARLPRPKLEAAAVAPLIEELAAFVRGELGGRRVRLDVVVPDGLPPIRLDPGQIHQALLNLIRNAAEAMPEGGTVRVTARWTVGPPSSVSRPDHSQAIDDRRPETGDRYMEISVEDTGPGVPPENLDRIFEPFFSTKDGGTGLGLAIARQIAADHDGTLTCENGPGGGAAFRLTLPLQDGRDDG